MTLDERITTALTSEPRSADIAALIWEVVGEVTGAAEDIETEQELGSLAAADTITRAKHKLDRFQEVLPRLEDKLTAAHGVQRGHHDTR